MIYRRRSRGFPPQESRFDHEIRPFYRPGGLARSRERRPRSFDCELAGMPAMAAFSPLHGL